MCIFTNCHNKDKYGGFCYKHRREYLVDKDTNRIILERWTNKCSDYLKEDIITTLNNMGFYEKKKKKNDLFIILVDKINALQTYHEKELEISFNFNK